MTEQGSAGRRLEERASSSRRRAGVGRRERDAHGGGTQHGREERHVDGKGRARAGVDRAGNRMAAQ